MPPLIRRISLRSSHRLARALEFFLLPVHLVAGQGDSIKKMHSNYDEATNYT